MSAPPPDAPGIEPGSSPKQVVSQAASSAAPYVAITSSAKPPGDTDSAIKTGTAIPAASLANPASVNAGVRQVTQNAQQQQQQQPVPVKTPSSAQPVAPPGAPASTKTPPTSSGAIPPAATKSSATPPSSKPSSATPAQASITDKNAEASQTIAKPKAPTFAAATGWKQVGGWVEDSSISAEESQDLLDRATLLEAYISDRFYGDWYHNTALIVLTAFYSWLVGKFGGGLAWLFIVLAFTATVYRTSIRRLRTRVRDDLVRESSLRKLETDMETMEWLNAFLVKFWLIYEPVLSETLVGTVNNILAGSTPSFIEGLSIETFTLGTKPPRIEFVRTHPRTDEDIVVMDWKASFIPNDLDDRTLKQLREKVNPKIVLAVRIGKGAISKAIRINVEDIMFSGLARIRLKLITTFPHVKTVDVQFMQPPEFDFSLKPIGADITMIPGLKDFIQSTVHANLGPMLYAPNSFQLNIEELMAGAGADSAIGVLAVTVFNGHGIKGSEAIGNTIDPYIVFSINNRAELARSKILRNTKNPVWNDTRYVLVNNLSESLTMALFDFNDIRKDKLIGNLNVPLETLESKPDQESLSGEIRDGTKSKGAVNYEMHWFPVLEGRKLDDGSTEPPPDSRTGILKLWVHQAKDLDVSKSLVGQLSPYVDMLVNGNLIHQSKSLKRINSPVWEDSFEFLVSDKNHCTIGVRIKDSRGLATDPVIATYQIKLPKLLESLGKGDDWFNLTSMGRVRLGATWKPVALKGGDAMRNYVEPIGVLRFHLIKGVDMKNLETIGKVDPYVRVFVNGFQRGRTVAIDDTLDPVWDEVIYVPVHSDSSRVVLEAVDAENIGKDRTLGQFSFNSSEFIKTDEKGNYLPFVNRQVRTSMFSMAKKSPKGTLHYSVSFYPSVRVMNPDDAKEKAEEARKKAEEDAKKAAAEPAKDEKKDEKKNEKDAKAAVSSDDTATLAEKEPEEEEFPDIPLSELIKSQSGVFALTILDAQLSESDTFIRILSDANVNPCYSSPRIQSRKQSLGETGEVSVLELDWSQVRFQITTKVNKPKKDDILGTLSMSTISLLKNAYDKPFVINIKSSSDRIVASLTVRARYFPLLMELDPSESINNMGSLSLDIIKADNVPVADRSGTSDPYAVVLLNGEKVYKTEKVKKTLNPVWNENCQVDIMSRTAAEFIIEVYDWDMASDDDFLGKVKVDLAQLEPLKKINITIPLQGESGTISLGLLFRPNYIIRRVDSSGISSTFTSNVPGKLVTGAASGAINVVGGAAGIAGGAATGVLGGIKGGASRFTGAFRHKKNGNGVGGGGFSPEPTDQGTFTPVASLTPDPNTVRQPLSPGSLSPSGGSNNDDAASVMLPGMLQGQLAIVSASGFKSVHLQVRTVLLIPGSRGNKEKEVLKTKSYKTGADGAVIKLDEITSFKASPDTQVLFKVYDHKKLGRSEDVGEGTFPITHFESGVPTAVDVGSGSLNVLLSLRDK
ncbi:uncharacterized protein SAPINGB_P005257 [Magnusiomyces paraingens]|uniref:Tricalbin n=1 Tax=Magnusiomyces paraingens TaxID=2606893 RepID=A0A5E8C1E2_9ASCO|nr:uncharacterized protein SAPINGB_P005257 [Saprochaete ingens]VVT56770.1 unnamed protein product [Saprochaete ingens]